MKEFFIKVLKLEWKPNPQDNPQHELQVKALLDSEGIAYEYQPNGSQQSPDFRVNYNNSTIDIECKSVASGAKPQYNTGLPKAGVVYIFSAKNKGTTIFFGEDIISEDMRASYKRMEEELWDIVHKYQDTPLWKSDTRGMNFYMRNMFVQKGTAERTNYFTHSEREACEQRVIHHQW